MPKPVKKRGRYYWYDFTVDKKRYRQSTGQTSEKLAIAVYNEVRARADRIAVFGWQEEITFREAAQLYLGKNGNDEKRVNALVSEFGARKVVSIKPGEIIQCALRRFPKGKPATLNRNVIAPAGAIINYAAKLGMASPIRIERFRVTIEPKGAGSKPWLKAFQVACRADGLPHLAALARFMFETGARISQATDLTYDNLNLNEATATLRTRKTGANGPEFSYRTASLTPAMVTEIANLPPSASRKVFRYASRSTARNRWEKVITRHKLQKLTRHEAGRHGFFTETIVRNNMDPVSACDAGGMKTVALALTRYTHAEGQRAKIMKVFG